MPDTVGTGTDGQNALYWQRRLLELTRLANALYLAVEETRQHQTILTKLGETEKIQSSDWESAMTNARRALTSARTLRTKFRKQLYTVKDTMRIRPHLAKDAPEEIRQAVERGTEYLNYLEAHGF